MKTKNLKKSQKPKKKQLKLKEIAEAVHAAGGEMSISLNPSKLPEIFPNDNPHVKMILEEAARWNKLATDMRNAKNPNPIAIEQFYRDGWSHMLVGAWLRCKLAGELLGGDRCNEREGVAEPVLPPHEELLKCAKAALLELQAYSKQGEAGRRLERAIFRVERENLAKKCGAKLSKP